MQSGEHEIDHRVIAVRRSSGLSPMAAPFPISGASRSFHPPGPA